MPLSQKKESLPLPPVTPSWRLPNRMASKSTGTRWFGINTVVNGSSSLRGKTADGQLVLQRMREHITAEVSHYRGKVASWDVVNEAIADDSEYLR